MQQNNHSILRLAVDAGVAFVTIDSPPINLLDTEMIAELDSVGRQLEMDESVRVVVLKSAVRDFFIAHADVGMILQASTRPMTARPALEVFHAALDRFRTMPKVTIAQIEGRCRGGGSELALACDMRFAARGKALLAQPELSVGIIPGGGGSTRLPRLVGRGRALEILIGGADFDADLAERYGYVNRALPPEEIASFVTALARRIAGFPAEAIALAKRAVIAQEPDLDAGLAAERECFLKSTSSPAARHLMAAALEAGLQTVAVETAPRYSA